MTDPSPEAALAECPFCGEVPSPPREIVGGLWAMGCRNILHSAEAMSWTSEADCIERWNQRTHGAHFASQARMYSRLEQQYIELRKQHARMVAEAAESYGRATKAEAERDAAVRDAERYRWLRDNSTEGGDDEEPRFPLTTHPNERVSMTYAQYVALKLAAMQAKGEGK